MGLKEGVGLGIVLLQSLSLYVYLPLCEGIIFGDVCVALGLFAYL